MSQNTLTLHVFPTDDDFFNLSPFCCKAEILLQMAELPYNLAFPADYKVFPKGKLPVLTDGDTHVEDSECIRKYLEVTRNACFTARLSTEQAATGYALCRMVEQHTYQALVYSRWGEEGGWSRTRQIFFEGFPDDITEAIRAQMSNDFRHGAFSHYSAEEIKAALVSDMKTLAALLAEKPYFFGDDPSFIDATAFGFIANFYAAPEQTWARDLVASHNNLVSYFGRALTRWYPAATAMTATE